MRKIIIVLAILIPASIRAQAPAWPDSSGPTSAGCYRIAVHPLTEAPPLRADMSLSTLLGYIYLDSLMRTPLDSAQWAAFNAIQSFDSLSQILKYLYAVISYDPVLFAEYGQDAPYINPEYWGKPATLAYNVEEKIGSVLTAMGDTTHIAYITTASFILHIKAIGVNRNWDPLGHLTMMGTPQSCVEAVILDTIKGQHILTGDCVTQSGTKRKGGKSDIVDSSSSVCFHFDYNPIWCINGSDNERSIPISGDSIMFSPDALGWNAIVPDSEYIVFFGTIYTDYNGTNSFFDIRPLMDGQGGIYPVVNGNVIDTKNYWHMGTSVALDDFESGLKETIYHIENP